MAKTVDITKLPEDQAVELLMAAFGGDETDARMALSIAKGEVPGDVIPVGKQTHKQGRPKQAPRWRVQGR